MNEIGILFDINTLGQKNPSHAAWKIFFRHCKGGQLADTTLWSGTVPDEAGVQHHCICVSCEEDEQVDYVRKTLTDATEPGLLIVENRFLDGPITQENDGQHTLAKYAEVDLAGCLTTDQYNYSSEQICAEAKWDYAAASVSEVINKHLFGGQSVQHRTMAANIIAKHGDEKDIVAIQQHLSVETDPSVRKACTEAVQKLKGSTVADDEGDPLDELFSKPMIITFRCKNCAQQYKMESKYAGQTGKCKKCGKPMEVPMVSDSLGAAEETLDTESDLAPAVMFRCDAAHTGAIDTIGREHKPSVMWKFQTEGSISSSPVIMGGIVFVGSDDMNLYAIDIATGKPKWQYLASGAIASAPAVSRGLVHFTSSDGCLNTIDTANGREKWKVQLPGPVYAPVLALKTIIVACEDRYLRAFDAQTGEEKWKHGTEMPVRNAPAVRAGKVFYTNVSGTASALNFATGRTIWVKKIEGKGNFLSSPAIGNGLIFAGCSEGVMHALAIDTGEEVWTFNTDAQILSSAAVAKNNVVFGSFDGSVYCLQEGTGTQVWKAEELGPVASSAVIVKDAAYIGTGDGHTCALDMETGKPLWKVPTGGAGQSCPWVEGEMVFIGSLDANLYALGDEPSEEDTDGQNEGDAKKNGDSEKSEEDDSVYIPGGSGEGFDENAPLCIEEDSSDSDSASNSKSNSNSNSKSGSGSGRKIETVCLLCSKQVIVEGGKIGEIATCPHCEGQFKIRG